MKLKFFVLLLYLLSNSKNETTAEDDNRAVTKYVYAIEGVPDVMESNNFYEKISIADLQYAE